MEPRRCASAASNHSDGMAVSHEQHCSPMSQQMIFNAPSQGHPLHVSGHGHMLPQQGHMAVPQQRHMTAEPNMHCGQGQAIWTLTDHPPTCLSLTEVPARGQLMSPVQPNTQTYPEIKSNQRHSSSSEPVPAYGGMSGPATTIPGQMYHSSKAMHQNVEGMIVSGHAPGNDGCMPHGGYYPVPHHGQHMQNSGQISWQSQRQYMGPGGQGAVPGQVYVSGVPARFNSQTSAQFRGHNPRYALNQEYNDVCCQQYHPMYGDVNTGSHRGTFPQQQHCVSPGGQRIMFARQPMQAPRHHPHMPADANFVYYAPPTALSASQQLSPSWSGSNQMMRSGVPVGYGKQPVWQRPSAIAYGSPLPGQHMPGYHLSPEPQMNAEFCDKFGGARQLPSPSYSFSPGLVHCYRPPPNQAVHSSMVNVDDKYVGACHVIASNSTPTSQDCAASDSNDTNVSTVYSTAGSDIALKDSTVVTYTTTPSHPLEHLPDSRQSVPHNALVCGTTASSLSSYNHPGYCLHRSNVNGSWTSSCTGEYYSYNAAAQYTQHQHTVRHVNPYNYYTSPPHVPHTGTSHYPLARCSHPHQPHSHPEEMQHWQGQAAQCRNMFSDKIANQPYLQHESLMTVSVSTCSESVSVISPVYTPSSTPAPVHSCKVDKQNLDDPDKIPVARMVAVKVTVANSGYHVPFSDSAQSVKDYNASPCVTSSLNFSPDSQAVVTAAGSRITLQESTTDSPCTVPSSDAALPPTNKDILFVQDKLTENIVAGTESQNSQQIAGCTLSSSSQSTKGPKCSGQRRVSRKTKKKKMNLRLAEDIAITSDDPAKCDAVKSSCPVYNIHAAAAPVKTESIHNFGPATSSPEQAAVVVPYGWRRCVDNGTVVYYSPSNVSLHSHDEIRQYLLKEGTCKCGLQCPLIVDKTFVFDPRQKQSKHLLADDIHAVSDRSNSLCNHRRKIIAMATFQQSTGFRFTTPETKSAPRLPVALPQTTEATVVTSVNEVKSVYGHAIASVGLSTIASSSHKNTVNIEPLASISTVSNQPVLAAAQPYSTSCVGPAVTSLCVQSNAGSVMHMQYCSTSAYGYNPMTLHPSRMTGHPNAPFYHPSTDFPARMSPTYRPMVTFAPNPMPYASPGYATYDRNGVHTAGLSCSTNIQVSRQFGGSVYGPLPISTQNQATDLPSSASDAQEVTRASTLTKSKKRSRAQQKDPYSSILDRSVPCPNIDVRQIIQEQRERLQKETASCCAVGVNLSSVVWTMPTTATSTTQQMVVASSGNFSTVPSPSITGASGSTMSSSSASLLAASDFDSTSVNTTANITVSSPRVSCISGSSLHIIAAVTSANVSTAVSCGSSLPYVMASTMTTTVTTHLHTTAPISTSVPCPASSVYAGPQQFVRWPSYSSHPLSAMTSMESSGNHHQGRFSYLQGQQVTGISPYPGPQQNLKDILVPSVTLATSIVANSGWLPGGEMVTSSASCSAKDDSPIQLVQNMVSGLETTRNSLAVATSLIISRSDSVPRRRRSGATDATVTTTATNSAANTDFCGDARFGNEAQQSNFNQTNSVQLPNEARCIQSKPPLPTTFAVTAVTGIQSVLPAASMVPSTYCAHPLTSTLVQSSTSPSSNAVIDIPDTVTVTATSSTNDSELTAVSSASDTETDSPSYSTSTACNTSLSDSGTTQQLNNSEVVDDDESTQDCDISISGTDLGDVLCTTGTQTSTPASAVSNCNSIESAVDGSESNDTGGPLVSAAGDVPPAEVEPVEVPCSASTPKPSPASDEKIPDDVHSEQIPVPTSAPMVLIPRVPQASFLLPQNIAFAPNPLVGHGFLQFQPPGEFGYGTAAAQSSNANAVGQPGGLGLVHFAAGPVVGPAVGNMMPTASDASGSFRLMAPVKSDSDAYSAAEFLPLMPATMPAGHILLQNIVPTGLAPTIVPFVQPAALCSLHGGNSALFAMSQGSMMSVGTPVAFASVPVPGQHREPYDHAPDQPDSTVDNSEMDTTDDRSSDDSADTEQVTSTDEPLDETSDNPKMLSLTVPTLHCSTSHGIHTSLTKTRQWECAGGVSSRAEHTTGASNGGHSTGVEQSRPSVASLKKRSQLSRSRLKKIRRDYGRCMLTSDRMPCGSMQPSLSASASSAMSASMQESGAHSLDAEMSPSRSEKVVDLLCSSLQSTDTAASDSSVSTTVSLNEGSNDGMDVGTADKLGHHSGAARKAWKKPVLSRRSRLRLRHTRHEAKLPVNTQLSQTETSDDVADSTTGSGPAGSPRTFNIGDLVWGPSRGFPSWPGKLVAESEVRGNHKLESGKIWVKWFGDHTFAQTDPDQLKTLSEGLETHHNARKKDRQGRKMNSNLEAAIQEAMTELDRQMLEQSAIRSSSSASERSQKTHDVKKKK